MREIRVVALRLRGGWRAVKYEVVDGLGCVIFETRRRCRATRWIRRREAVEKGRAA